MDLDLNTILLLLAAVLALPGGLFVASVISPPRGRFLVYLGGALGSALVAAGVYYFVQTTNPSLDALSYFLGTFFGCSIGVIVGALAVNFLLDLGSRSSDASSIEL